MRVLGDHVDSSEMPMLNDFTTNYIHNAIYLGGKEVSLGFLALN